MTKQVNFLKMDEERLPKNILNYKPIKKQDIEHSIESEKSFRGRFGQQ